MDVAERSEPCRRGLVIVEVGRDRHGLLRRLFRSLDLVGASVPRSSGMRGRALPRRPGRLRGTGLAPPQASFPAACSLRSSLVDCRSQARRSARRPAGQCASARARASQRRASPTCACARQKRSSAEMARSASATRPRAPVPVERRPQAEEHVFEALRSRLRLVRPREVGLGRGCARSKKRSACRRQQDVELPVRGKPRERVRAHGSRA